MWTLLLAEAAFETQPNQPAKAHSLDFLYAKTGRDQTGPKDSLNLSAGPLGSRASADICIPEHSSSPAIALRMVTLKGFSPPPPRVALRFQHQRPGAGRKLASA